ncbi:hypothetical protein MKW92_022234 [Papaver armeniacum]|nr:hypothetical protein MKW92_022234 [Papaver armeniacum]
MLINQDSGGSRRKDRISELPESLIHLILSLLPTKCVVSTSVLSKRWRYIWTSVPVIDLLEVKFPEYVGLEDTDETDEELERVQNLCLSLEQSLMNFVDKKLSLHHEAQDIKKFYLDTSDEFDPELEKLEEWLSALFTRHNLEEFVFYAENSLEEGFFPLSGRYTSLVIMELDTWEPVYLPDAVNFPNLKICKLSHAYLHMYSDDPTQQFFSNLRVLDELELIECQWDISDQLLISAPALKYLLITGPRQCTDFDDNVPMYGFMMNIFAPNLLSLRYTAVSAKDYILHRFEKLVDVEIDFERDNADMPLPQENVAITTKVLKELSNVKCLKISGETFEELLFPDDLFTNWPMFINLVCLELTSGISFSKHKTLLNFLRISPNLKTLVFAQQSSTDSGWTPDMIPRCVLLHLKSVKFCEFYGCLEDLNAVKTFLKNARVLKRMIIKFDSDLSTDEQNKVMKKLLKFPRGSPRCKIQVS